MKLIGVAIAMSAYVIFARYSGLNEDTHGWIYNRVKLDIITYCLPVALLGVAWEALRFKWKPRLKPDSERDGVASTTDR